MEQDQEPAFITRTIGIVGLGLMGGSLALALKEKSNQQRIIGITRTRATLDAALQRGAIDVASDQLSATRDADIVVLAAPVRTILKHINNLKEIARQGSSFWIWARPNARSSRQ